MLGPTAPRTTTKPHSTCKTNKKQIRTLPSFASLDLMINDLGSPIRFSGFQTLNQKSIPSEPESKEVKSEVIVEEEGSRNRGERELDEVGYY